MLLNNKHLEFEKVVSIHGEVLKEYATYPTGAKKPLLYFEIKNNYIEVRGSFHKYFENGTNCNTYSINEFKATLDDFKLKFDIRLDSLVHNLEIGLNIELSQNLKASEVINDCMLFKMYEFNTELYKNGTNGIMKLCKLKQYHAKVYDKGLQQMDIPNLIRIEKKFIKMQRLGKSITLATLLEPSFISDASSQLLDLWNDVILYDRNIDVKSLSLPKQKLYKNWSNANYLRTLIDTKKRKSKFNRERNFYKKIIAENCKHSTHAFIYESIFEQLSEIEKLVSNLPLVEKEKQVTNLHLV